MPRKANLIAMIDHIKEEEQVFNQLTPDNQSINTAHFLATHPEIRRRWQEDVLDLRQIERY